MSKNTAIAIIGALTATLIFVGVLVVDTLEQSSELETMSEEDDEVVVDADEMSREGGMMGGMSIKTERVFIENMIPHHKEAIVTAGEVLERGGTTPAMRDLAENIIRSQTAEVALMKESYANWFDGEYNPTGEYKPMMRELEGLEGERLDRVFLHDMTMHHMGAIMMARSLRPHLEHDVMDELTANIITNQSREIETMRDLFRGMGN